jgi:nicotinate-nucleotide adenylyltransferase
MTRAGRRALFGGSFDPVHLGHLVVAQLICELEGLDRVVFVPARRSPHKRGTYASARDRLAMLRLGLRGDRRFQCSDIELRRRGASYTIDTVREVARTWREKPILILGGDALLDLPTWRESEALLREARVVVYARPGFEAAAVRARELGLRYHAGVVSCTSSRALRALARRGISLRYQVPELVRRYIEERRLYGWRERVR